MSFSQLKTLVNEGSFRTAWKLAKDHNLKPKSFPEYSTLLHLHSNLTRKDRILREPVDEAPVGEVEDEGVANEAKPKQTTKLLRLKLSERQEIYASAIDLFREMLKNGFVADFRTYNFMLSMMTDMEKLNDIETLLSEMVKVGFLPDIHFHNYLLSTARKLSDEKKMLATLEVIQNAGLELNLNSYAILLDYYAKRKDEERVQHWLDAMQTSGFAHNHVTCAILAQFWCTVNKLALAREQVRQFLANKQPRELELRVYLMLIDHSIAAEDLETAKYCFGVMKEAGYRREIRYNPLLTLLLRKKEFGAAMALLEEMKANDINPTIPSVHAMIHWKAKQGDTKTVCSLIESMKLMGYRPNVYVYNTLLEMQSRLGHLDKAAEIYGEMVRRGVRPDLVTCWILVSMYVRLKHLNEAVEVLNQMTVEYSLKPKQDTYSKLILACVFANDRRVRLLYEEMRKQNMKPPYKVYTFLMTAALNERRYRSVVTLYLEMRSLGLNINPQIFTIFRKIYDQMSNPKQILGFCPNIGDFNFVSETAEKFAKFKLNEKEQEEAMERMLRIVEEIIPSSDPPAPPKEVEKDKSGNGEKKMKKKVPASKAVPQQRSNLNSAAELKAASELTNEQRKESEKILEKSFWSANRE
jgi:pentatricopeptide repeat protein